MFVTTDDGVRIHVEAAPENGKPPLLFSNSLGTNLHMWDVQAAEFAGSFHVIRYDSRGHGQSDAPIGIYSIERLGRDALAVLDALGIERTRFVGLSKGGMVGQWLGAHAPERIERLVLSNTSAHLPAPDLWSQRIEIATSHGMTVLERGIIERWFTPEYREHHPREVEWVREMVLGTPHLGYAASCAAIRDMDQRPTNPTIRVPTLVIAGARDPATPPEHGKAIHESVPGSEFVLLDAAHLSNIERPVDYNQTLRAFL